INKVRHIASTLLDVPRIRKGQLALRAEDYLDAFLDVLMKLERVNLSSGPNGEMVLGSEEDEEAELRHWANIRAHQSRFATTDGVLSEV
ncbi:hypothetical protein MMC13_000359, partial [Lambiella insularis]|nr:hypothetical protein [Lambiella insularis]